MSEEADGPSFVTRRAFDELVKANARCSALYTELATKDREIAAMRERTIDECIAKVMTLYDPDDKGWDEALDLVVDELSALRAFPPPPRTSEANHVVRLQDSNNELRATIKALVEALEPFAAEAECWGDRAPDDLNISVHSMDAEHFGDQSKFTIGDLRRARAALVLVRKGV